MQLEENIIKSIRNLFKLKKEIDSVKGKMIGDIRTLFEQQKKRLFETNKTRNLCKLKKDMEQLKIK